MREASANVALDVEGTYLRYGPMVLRRCRALLRNDAKAQDAMQDVFVSLLRHEERLRRRRPCRRCCCASRPTSASTGCAPTGAAPRTRDERAAAAHRRGADDGDAGSERVAHAWRADLLAKLFRADDPLAASTRTIAVMHLVDGMTLEEVAREARLSVSGVRKRLRTLRGRLQELEGV